MGEAVVLEHIRTWEAAGVIDPSTAERLLEAEAREPGPPRPPSGAIRTPIAGLAGGLSAVEVFVWLGLALVLAAWYWEVGSRAPGFGAGRRLWLGVGTAIPALLAAVGGLAARLRSDRVGRAAGLLLLASGVQLAFVGYFAIDALRPVGDPANLTFGAATWLTAAVIFRRVHPSLPTAASVAAAICATGVFADSWLRESLFGRPDWYGPVTGGVIEPGPIAPFLGALWWLIVAAVIGLVGWAELRSADAEAARRGFMARLTAGMVAVAGVAASLLGGSWATGTGQSDRLDPFVGDVAVLAVATALVWLATRTRSSAWLYPAGLAIVIGLSDLNASYLADSVGMAPALLVEGLLLLGAGAGTEALRRRLRGAPSPPAGEPETAAVRTRE